MEPQQSAAASTVEIPLGGEVDVSRERAVLLELTKQLAAITDPKEEGRRRELRAQLVALTSAVQSLEQRSKNAPPPLEPAPAVIAPKQEHQQQQAPPPPPVVTRRPRLRPCFVVCAGVALALLLAVLLAPSGSVSTVVQRLLHRNAPAKQLIVYQMSKTLNSDGCVLVTPPDLQKGVFFNKWIYEELRDSMLWHMVQRNDSGICAQHVGVPLCYCMYDMRRFDAEGNEYVTMVPDGNGGQRRVTVSDYQSGEDYLEMFNQEINGVSTDSIAKVQEANALCEESHWRSRFEVVVASYMRPGSPPRRFREVFSGTHSYNIQHFFDIQHGQTGCRDDAVDLLRGRAIDPKSRTAAGARVLMFDHPNAHRTAIASPPPPAPLPDMPVDIPNHRNNNNDSTSIIKS